MTIDISIWNKVVDQPTHTDEHCNPESHAATKRWQSYDRLLSPEMLDERR